MRPLPFSVRAAVVGAIVTSFVSMAEATELVMVEQSGCHYCAQWNAEIGPIYPKTAEGSFAPLKRVEIGGREIDDYEISRRVNFTPTFILLDDGGRELARLEGYPGEDFFWGMLQKMLVETTDFRPSPMRDVGSDSDG